MKRFSWLVVFPMVILGLLFNVTPTQAAKPLKIGLVDCYTGPASAYTNDVRDAFKLAMNKINAEGGILGRKVEVLTRDTKFKVDIGLAAAKELVMRENVDILMGTISSSVALAVSDLAKKEKLPFFVTFSKSSKISGEKGHRYVFQVSENTTMAGKAAAAVMVKPVFLGE